MAGLGFALAGAAKGLGDGIQQQAEQRRQAAMAALAREQDIADRDEGRAYAEGQRAEGRAYTEGLAADERGRSDARRDQAANVYESLFGTESGGDFGAQNDEGYNGRMQVGRDRLDDWSASFGGPNVSLEDYRTNPELQKEVEQWHFGDINDFIDKNDLMRFEGQTMNGVQITRSGMVAMAHLGGQGGMRSFLTSNGSSNPQDSNGTSLSDYARTHGGLSTDMSNVWQMLGDENTSSAQRTQILKGLDVGGSTDQALTGEEWIDNGDGTETRHGRLPGSGVMQPYTLADGKPVTRAIKADEVKLSSGLIRDLEKRFVDPATGAADYGTVDTVSLEIERLMTDEGMSETQARADAIGRMEYEKITTDAVDGWFGDTPESTQDGEFLGTFSERRSGGGLNVGAPAAPVAPAPASDAPASALRESPEVLQLAREAIAAGADPDAVKARLIESGIDPKGL